MNNPQSILSALSLARTGRIYDLAVDLGSQVRGLPEERASPFTFQRESFGDPTGAGLTFSAEIAGGSTHHGTHIDALIHAQYAGRVFGGRAASDVQNEFGWTEHGAETIAPIVCRGIVLDLVGPSGKSLPDGSAAGVEELEQALSASGTSVCPGDAILLRTGKIRDFFHDPQGAWHAGPGISPEAARWLCERKPTVVGIDAASIDPLPITKWHGTAHEELLVRSGINIVENLMLEALIEDAIREFTFVCLPLKIAGATGSWVRPISIA